MGKDDESRRAFLKYGITGVGSAVFLSACVPPPAANQANTNAGTNTTPAVDDGEGKPKLEKKGPGDIEVTAVEDLMREHGVLRRALLIYSEAVVRLRKNAAGVSPDALQKTAKLFRTFGEEYHEKKLEETYIFPKIKEKGDADAIQYVDILIAQHTRGRDITDHIISVTKGPKLGSNAAVFANTLEAFVRMYQHHAAREDTIVFPAWKDLITPDEYDKLNDTFEDIEHEQFGEDGFEDAVKQIDDIETILGLNDLSKFTAPPPSK